MRYFIEEFLYDGNAVRMSGWCMPEYPDDHLTYELRDREGKMLPLTVRKTARNDVDLALAGRETQSEKGFSFEWKGEEYRYAALYVGTEEHEIDRIRIPVRMDEAMLRFKKEKRRLFRKKK